MLTARSTPTTRESWRRMRRSSDCSLPRTNSLRGSRSLSGGMPSAESHRPARRTRRAHARGATVCRVTAASSAGCIFPACRSRPSRRLAHDRSSPWRRHQDFLPVRGAKMRARRSWDGCCTTRRARGPPASRTSTPRYRLRHRCCWNHRPPPTPQEQFRRARWRATQGGTSREGASGALGHRLSRRRTRMRTQIEIRSEDAGVSACVG